MDSLNKISCKNCSAELLFDPTTQMSSCNFCGAQFEISTAEETEIKIKPDGLIPFSFDKKEFKNAVLTWLSEGDYTPDDILTTSIFDDINGIYLPQYFFQGRYSGNWSASSGYERLEEYIAWDSINKRNVRRTRTVTDWRPSNGQVAGEYSILGFAAELKNLPPSILPFMQNASFDRGQIKPFNNQYVTGYNIMPFGFDSETVWDTLGKGQADIIAQADVKKRIPGDKYRDLFYDIMYDHKKVINLLQPAYIIHYEYNEKKYFTYIDGDKINRIEGERPVDKKRKDHVHLLKRPIRIFWWVSMSLLALLIIIFINVESQFEHPACAGVFIAYSVIILISGIYAYVTSNKAVKEVLTESKRRRQEILNALKEGTSIPDFNQPETPPASNEDNAEVKEISEPIAQKSADVSASISDEPIEVPIPPKKKKKSKLWLLLLIPIFLVIGLVIGGGLFFVLQSGPSLCDCVTASMNGEEPSEECLKMEEKMMTLPTKALEAKMKEAQDCANELSKVNSRKNANVKPFQHEADDQHAYTEQDHIDEDFEEYNSIITTKRAFFHVNPISASKTNRYIVKGDICLVLKIKGDFAYVSFYNERRDKTTKGWVKTSDMKYYEDELDEEMLDAEKTKPIVYMTPLSVEKFTTTATSTMPSSGDYTYESNNVKDGNLKTWWSPNNKDSSPGISIDFNEPKKVHGLQIHGGSHYPNFITKSGASLGNLYYKNQRVKTIEVAFIDGDIGVDAFKYSLEDVDDIQQILFKNHHESHMGPEWTWERDYKDVKWTRIYITIKEVYESNKWDDICISHLMPLISTSN